MKSGWGAKFIKGSAVGEQIWRAVTLPGILEHAGRRIPDVGGERSISLTGWLMEPGEVREIMRASTQEACGK